MAMVLEVNPVRELTTRDGRNTLMSTLSVGDSGRDHLSITLWGYKANWVRKLQVGDILVLEKLKFKLFQSTLAGNSTSWSSMRIIGSVTEPDGKASARIQPLPLEHPWMKKAKLLLDWGKHMRSILLPFVAASSKQSKTNNGNNNPGFTQLSPTPPPIVEFHIVALTFSSGKVITRQQSGKYQSHVAPSDLAHNIYVGCSGCELPLTPDNSGVFSCPECPLQRKGTIFTVRWLYKGIHVKVVDRGESKQHKSNYSAWIRVRHREICQLASGISAQHIAPAADPSLVAVSSHCVAKKEPEAALWAGQQAAAALTALVRDKKLLFEGLLCLHRHYDSNGTETMRELVLEKVERFLLK
mmetsp:Transcript_316/g.374  ORF Transcript_316/g.374 Transcript_316/m.374 type:complete len:355 (+) Transcript_316:96-1160(+)